jgi:hypothetical protein
MVQGPEISDQSAAQERRQDSLRDKPKVLDPHRCKRAIVGGGEVNLLVRNLRPGVANSGSV